MYIIVPGTWAGTHGWHSLGGDFFDALQQAAYPTPVISFWWSGENNYIARIRAAQNLVQLLFSYPPETEIILVSHSHGTNVAILASHILAKTTSHMVIRTIYAFATPVDNISYIPNMDCIGKIYHFFSFADFVQPAFGLFERTFTPHERIFDISVTINNQEPHHSSIHAPCIARILPTFPALLHEQQFDPTHPAHFAFYDTAPPQYTIDYDREHILQEDRAIINALLHIFHTPYGHHDTTVSHNS